VSPAAGRAPPTPSVDAELPTRASDLHGPLASLFGRSAEIARVRLLLERAAWSDAPVLLTGETGTGKELAARALHSVAARREGPFVPVNCSAIPAGLLEDALFGHRRGAFTDAQSDAPGAFSAAGAGTVFLDEVGDLPVELQPKLLRALQERRVLPLGAAREVPFQARVVAATNRDLRAALRDGRFREDLYHRLAVLPIELPPLRDRPADILPTLELFLEHAARALGRGPPAVTVEAAVCLVRYPWPGNVRELRNLAERIVCFGQGDEIRPSDLPAHMAVVEGTPVSPAGAPDAQAMGAPAMDQAHGFPSLRDVENAHVVRALKLTGGNRARAARLLGISERGLRRKLARLHGRASAPGRRGPS
jgi:DNA-binding NtrC family response regulator